MSKKDRFGLASVSLDPDLKVPSFEATTAEKPGALERDRRVGLTGP